MKKTFLRILPVVAAVLLATSCSKEDNGDVNSVDTPQTTEVPDPTPEQPAEQSKTVKVPFSVNVDGGESLSKITYALKKDDKDNDIWNKVSRTFDDDDLQTGKHPISLTVKGAVEGSGITESTIPLTKGSDGKFYFKGEIEVDPNKLSDFNSEPGIALVGEFTVDGTPLPTSSDVSLDKLMASCAHTYKTKDDDHFTSKSTTVMLYDQNAYLAIDLPDGEETVSINGTSYALKEGEGKLWIAVTGGTKIHSSRLSLFDKEAVSGHVYSITRSASSFKKDAEFTVGKDASNNPIKVKFSPGNLLYQASPSGKWEFAARQWDYVGKAEGNTVGSDNRPNSVAYIDLFCWVGKSGKFANDDVKKYGVILSWQSADCGDENNGGNEALASDWGNVIGPGWRTITNAEWEYLIQSRTSASSLYGGGTVNGVFGLILLPDDWNLPEGSSFVSGVNADNSYEGDAWTAMEAAGAVFLPAAGEWRSGVDKCGTVGRYWTSTSHSSYLQAYYIFFSSSTGVGANSSDMRCVGFPVRLVYASE